MSQSSNQSVPATPESHTSLSTIQRENLIHPRDFVYHTPGNSPASGSFVMSSYPPSPDISFVFRPIPYAPVMDSTNIEEQPPSPPSVDARRCLKFGKKKPSVKKPFRKNFRNGIFKVLKKIDPDGTISSKGMDVMNDLICDLFERIAISSKEFCKKTDKQTLMVRDVSAAVRMVLPGQLGAHAFYEGWKAAKRVCEFEDAAKNSRD